jgi:hypothetical protein
VGRERSKVLGTKRDAEAFDAEIRRRKRTGEIATMDAGRETLASFRRGVVAPLRRPEPRAWYYYQPWIDVVRAHYVESASRFH